MWNCDSYRVGEVQTCSFLGVPTKAAEYSIRQVLSIFPRMHFEIHVPILLYFLKSKAQKSLTTYDPLYALSKTRWFSSRLTISSQQNPPIY